MNLFNKSKFKRRENQNAGRSQLGLVEGNVSLVNSSSGGPSTKDENILVQDCLCIIDKQTAEINELKHQLNLNRLALDDCFKQTNFASYNEGGLKDELQRKTQETTQLKSHLKLLDRRAEEQHEKAQERIKDIYSRFEETTGHFNKQIDALNAEQRKKEQEAARALAFTTENFNQQIDTLSYQLLQGAQEAARAKDQLDLERSEKSRAQRIAEQLAEQLSKKGETIHEQDSQIQTQTETLEQTRLSLNRTRNELNQEKQRAAQAVRECATKSQQLEFVQQQCASLQEQLRSRNIG